MKHLQALLLLVVLTASGVAAEGPAPTYRAPRAHDGHPDLQGVWNFASGVPLQRRAAFGDRKLMTKEEFDKERVADPKTFQDTIALSFPMARVDARPYESACHEGNYAMANTPSGVRKEEETRKTP